MGAVVRIVYADRHGKVSRRDVEAGGFYGSLEGWFLVGWCRLRDAGRIFRLDRIRRATLTAEIASTRNFDQILGWVPGPTFTPE